MIIQIINKVYHEDLLCFNVEIQKNFLSFGSFNDFWAVFNIKCLSVSRSCKSWFCYAGYDWSSYWGWGWSKVVLGKN